MISHNKFSIKITKAKKNIIVDGMKIDPSNLTWIINEGLKVILNKGMAIHNVNNLTPEEFKRKQKDIIAQAKHNYTTLQRPI